MLPAWARVGKHMQNFPLKIITWAEDSREGGTYSVQRTEGPPEHAFWKVLTGKSLDLDGSAS